MLGVRAERSMVKALAAGLAKHKMHSISTDLSFIQERLVGQDADLTVDLAALLRNGTLRKAVDQLAGRSEVPKPMGLHELPRTMTRFRMLRDAELNTILTECDDTITSQMVRELGREHKINLVTFALSVSPSHRLPAFNSALRNINILARYCKLRYIDCGSRLYNTDISTPGAVGYYKLDGDKVRLDVQVNRGEDGKLLGFVWLTTVLRKASDLKIVDNHSHSAELLSQSQCFRVSLKHLFSMQQAAAPSMPETTEWNISAERWPAAMRAHGAETGGARPSPTGPRRLR